MQGLDRPPPFLFVLLRTRYLIVLVILLSNPCVNLNDAYFANWGDIGRAQEPTCVNIPKNMSLCSNIQYEQMRLPNLLAHDTLTEVAHQSSSWVPLLNVRCHPDTQLFLCSLFTPVCLERPIYPCRSLCQAVQTACEKRMTTYGYHWPDMLRCENFPEDNDMCLKALHSDDRDGPQQELTESPETVTGEGCEVCQPVSTYENILDNYCRADFVLRTKVKAVNRQRAKAGNARVYKPAPGNLSTAGPALRRPQLLLTGEASCCGSILASADSDTRYIVMGSNTTWGLVPTFVMEWNREKSTRDAVRMFAGLDCSDPSLFTPDTQSGAILHSGQRGARKGGRKKGQRRRKGNRHNVNTGAADEAETAGRRNKGVNRGGGRRGDVGGGRGGGREGRRRGNRMRGEETREDRRERRKRKKNKKLNKQNNIRQRQRLGEEEKERRKQFIQGRIEQSRGDGPAATRV